MLPKVLLLLSVFTVRGSACDELHAVSNLQESIRHEEQSGFLQVFPRNYYVQHRFNDSTQCEDSCCVFSAAFLLSDSWKQLLKHIERIHLKHDIISELIYTLDTIWKGRFQETPNPLPFPSIHSSPRALLTFTSDVLSKWLAMECPGETLSCVFPSPASYGKEGEREKRWLTIIPKNGDTGLSASPTLLFCILCGLRMLKELG